MLGGSHSCTLARVALWPVSPCDSSSHPIPRQVPIPLDVLPQLAIASVLFGGLGALVGYARSKLSGKERSDSPEQAVTSSIAQEPTARHHRSPSAILGDRLRNGATCSRFRDLRDHQEVLRLTAAKL